MDAHDPYQPPKATLSANPQADPAAKLFKVSGIGMATFLGSVLAGGLLMAANYRALGKPDLAARATWYSLFATVAVLLLGALLPSSIPGAVFVVPLLMVMIQLVKQHQGAAITSREAAGLPMHSNWLAAGIALLVVVALVLTIIVGLYALGAMGVSIGEGL